MPEPSLEELLSLVAMYGGEWRIGIREGRWYASADGLTMIADEAETLTDLLRRQVLHPRLVAWRGERTKT